MEMLEQGIDVYCSYSFSLTFFLILEFPRSNWRIIVTWAEFGLTINTFSIKKLSRGKYNLIFYRVHLTAVVATLLRSTKYKVTVFSGCQPRFSKFEDPKLDKHN